jgi:YVTN family beta-propeller protein
MKSVSDMPVVAAVTLALLFSARLPAAAGSPPKDRRVVEVTIPVEAQPFDLAVSPDGKTLYVTSVSAGKLSVIRDNRVQQVVAIGTWPTGLALSRDGKTLYVALYMENALAVVDASTLEVRKKIPVGQNPIGVALPTHERFVAVTCYYSGSVDLVSTATGEVKSLKVATWPYFSALSPDDQRMYTTSLGSSELVVTQIELDRGPLKAADIHLAELKRIPVGQSPVGVATSLDGKWVYVANYYAGTIDVVSAAGLALQQTLTVGSNPYWVAVHPRDGTVMVSAFGSPHLDVIHPDQKRTQIQVQNALIKLYFSPDGRRLFTTNYNLNQVNVIE